MAYKGSNVRVRIKNKGSFIRQIKKLRKELLRDQFYEYVARHVIDRIVKRTYSGVDAKGNAAPPKKDGSIRRLYKTGKLLRSPKYRIKGKTIIIYIPKGKLGIIAEVHNYGMLSGDSSKNRGFRMPRMYWFDLSRGDKISVRKMVNDEIEKRLRDIMGALK